MAQIWTATFPLDSVTGLTHTQDMSNTAPTAPIARNIAGLRWIENGRTATFQSSRCYGIVDAEGRMLSTNGVTPSTWGSSSAAATVAQYAAWNPAKARWIVAL